MAWGIKSIWAEFRDSSRQLKILPRKYQLHQGPDPWQAVRSESPNQSNRILDL